MGFLRSRDIPRIPLVIGKALLVAVFLCGPTHAQFVNVIIDANAPRNPHCKSIGDIDGDGQIDILAASSSDHTEGLFWYRYPDWTKYSIHTGSFTTDMQVGDIDGDGDLDAIIPRGRDRGTSLWWYENPRPSGNPAVGPWVEHFIDSVGAHDVEVGDLNGDGKLDIVVREDTTVIFLQSSPDRWIRRAVNPRPTEGTSLGDLDNDGDLDIALSGYWLENPMPGGNPDTADWVEHLFAAGWPNAVATHIADINHDGRPDILIAPSESALGHLAWYEALDPKTGPWIQHIVDADISYLHKFKTGDMDRDGTLDIVTAEMHQSPAPQRVSIYFNNAAGSGLQWTAQIVGTTGSHNLRVGDIGDDGDLDIIGANWNTAAPNGAPIEMWENQLYSPPLSLDRWERHVIDADRPWRAVFVTPVDINGDGRKDVVTGAWWYRNPGTPGGSWIRNAIGDSLYNMATVYDFDGDGTMDVLGTQGQNEPTSSTFVWARNDGAGNFTTHKNIDQAVGSFLQGVAVARFDAGGPLEVALSWHDSPQGTQLFTLPADPTTGTWSWKSISAVSQYEQLSAGDIDGDGDADLLMGTQWLENADPSWVPLTLDPTAMLPDRNRLVDINKDGRLDAVVGFETSVLPGRLAWYEQPAGGASGTWTEHLITTDIIGAMSVDVADLDNDGDFDVVAGEHNLANPAAARLLVFENTDSVGLSWTQHLVFTGDEHHAGAQLVDIDNDGDLDIVSIGWTHDDVLLYENLAITTTLEAPSITGQPASRTVLVGQTATFSVTATGTAPLSYRWQKNSVDIPGATGSSYTTPAAVAGDNGSTYRCVITNVVSSVTSNSATLTVNTAPPPVVNILTNGGFESGSTGWNFYTNGSGFTSVVTAGSTGSGQAIRISVTTAGTNVQLYQAGLTLQPNTSYQLSFDAYSSSGHDLEVSLNKHTPPYTNYGLAARFFNLSTSWQSYVATFTTGNFSSTVTDGRLMFWLAPYDAAGDLYYIDNIVLARAADLTPEPPVITQEPVNQTVTEGQTATFAVTATGTVPLAYQWQKDGVSIAGASGASYTTPATTLADSGRSFRCVVVNAIGSDTSASAMLTVNRVPLAGPSITGQPANRTVLVGQTATFSVTATGTAPLSYRWQKNSVDIPGATGSSYTTPATVAGDNGSTYRCVVTNAVSSVTSNSATLTVNIAPPPVVNILTNGGFESGSTGWNFYTNGSGFTSVVTPGSTGSGQAIRISVTTAGTNVQLYQAGLTLQPNTSYQLSFDAYSSSGHDLEVSLNKHTPPYTNYGLAARFFNLSTSWQSYVATFTTGNFSSGVTDGRLMFWLAPYDAAGDLYYIDNIVLARAADLTPEPPVIMQEPVNQIVTEGQSATFSVTATGTAPLAYQWQMNGGHIIGATGPSYTTPATSAGDSGSVYRCIVTNSGGADTSVQAVLGVLKSGGPLLSIWYGTNQAFGRLGTPQRWVNILGNVSDSNGVASLSYTLNGGTANPLLIGPNLRRLAREGDFNIDIAFASLQAGENSVTVTATDSGGYASSSAIRIMKTAGAVWPTTWTVSWATPTGLQDSAQIVDGKWAVVPGGIRPVEAGYERLVSLGDTLWTDYEASALITVHAIDSMEQAYDSVSVAPGLGFMLRWTGHADASGTGPLYAQPKSGYLPFGAFGRYVWRSGFNNGLESRWELLGNNRVLLDSSTATSLTYGIQYYFKMRVTGVAGQGALYSFKAWPAMEVEPPTWMLRGQGQATDPQRGSLLIVAHHVDATIGTVRVRPVDSAPPVLSDVSVAAGMTTATITWKTNEPSSSRVYRGLTTLYSDSVISGAMVLSHTAGFTGLTPDTVYHFKIVCIDSAGNTVTSSDLTFATSSIPPPAFRSDNFDGPGLNTSLWTFINPRSDAVVFIAGAGTTEARLSISVPAGVSHDVWAGNFAPRVMQSAANMDFEVEVKFDAPLGAQYQMQGVLVQQDEGNFLRFDFVRDNAGNRLFAASFVGGAVSVRTDTRIASGTPLYMRVKRVGNSWAQSYSFGGANWTAAPAFNHTLAVSRIGPFAGNHGEPAASSPAWTALIDYFLNTAAPGGLAKGGMAESHAELAAPVPERFTLEGNYPNPFNPSTTIRYGLPEPATISIRLYSMLGQEITTLAEGERHAGYHEVIWDGRNANGGHVSSGLILCRLVATGVSGKTYTDVRRMALVR